MSTLDVDVIERELRQVLEQERRDALEYTVLTVLATPAFVALAAGAVAMLVACVFLYSGNLGNRLFEPVTFFTMVNLFLAYMIVFVLVQSNRDLAEFTFDKFWMGGVVLFVLLLVLTYGTYFLQAAPLAFGLVHAVIALIILGLLGQVRLPPDIAEMPEGEHTLLALLLAVSGFVVSAYGQIGRGVWLWRLPTDDQIKVGAWLLGKMAVDPDRAVGSDAMRGPIVDVLVRLDFIGVTEAGAALTPKGLEFVRAANGDET